MSGKFANVPNFVTGPSFDYVPGLDRLIEVTTLASTDREFLSGYLLTPNEIHASRLSPAVRECAYCGTEHAKSRCDSCGAPAKRRR